VTAPGWRWLPAGLLAALLGGMCVGGGPAAAGDWNRYQIILWHDHGPAALAAARRLGVTAGMLFGVRDDPPAAALRTALDRRAAPLRAAGLGCYVENIATDVYAAYHRWQPGRALTWRFDAAQARHQADRADRSVFVREPSLSDPAALARVAARLRAHARALGSAPLYYDLGDETGIADLTAAWDFDLSPHSLAAMRVWLREQYGALAALNAEWGTRFTSWDEVQPMLTDAALGVADGNFAAWADFKAWMDTAFARAVAAGTAAVHQADPRARAGLEGAQVPGWGGYDYTQLAGAVDVMEITGADSARAIAQALNPALITLATTDGATARDRHDLWQAILAGSRGVILWDPDGDIARPDGTPGPRGPALAGIFADLAGPPGQRLLAGVPQTDPVAILYSPASFRLAWILDRQVDAAAGKDWSRRRSETELEDDAWRAALRQATEGLAHRFLQPRWLTPALLAAGALQRDGIRAVILPHALALADAEVAAIRGFVAGGGLVLADTPPGGYDGHGRRRASLATGGPLLDGITLLPGLPRAALGERLAAAGVVPRFALTRPDGTPAEDATLRVLRAGTATILAIQRDFPGTGPDSGPGSGDGADREALVLTLDRPRAVRDLRGTDPARQAAAPLTRAALLLDTVTPALLDVSAGPGR
jgi:hypothetical protein